MVKRILTFLYTEVGGLHEAAFLLGFFAILSQVLGLMRDRLLTHFFGVGTDLDIYYAAFRIPDILFVSIASLISLMVLIPILTEKMDDHEAIRAFMNSIFTAFMVLMIGACIGAYIFMPAGIHLFFPDLYAGAGGGTLISLARIILLSPIFLGISNIFASITQTHKKFFLYAVSPLLYNIGIIVGILFLRPIFGISGLAFGVVLGAFLHMGIQLPYIAHSGFLPVPTFSIDLKAVRRVIFVSLPRTLALVTSQLTFLALLAYAGRIQEGSITVFNLAYNLQSILVSIIGMSYAVAAFPTLSRLFRKGEQGEFIHQLVAAARHTLFWTIPAFVLFILLRAHIVRVILGSGKFTWANTRLTAALLAMFACSIAAQCLSLIFIRGLYASGDTKKPLIVNVLSSVASIFSVFLLLQLWHAIPSFRHFTETLFKIDDISGSSVLMLPLGFSIGMIGNAAVFWMLYRRHFKPYAENLGRSMLESFGAAMAMGLAVYGLLNVLAPLLNVTTFLGIFLQGFWAGVGGLVVCFLVLRALKNRELDEIMRSLHRTFWKTKAIAVEQREL